MTANHNHDSHDSTQGTGGYDPAVHGQATTDASETSTTATNDAFTTTQAPQEHAAPTPGGAGSTGLDSNIAGALSYLFGFLTGLVFFLVEKEDAFVRFHAAQSMVVFGGIGVLAIGTSIVSTVLTSVLFGGSSFFLWGIISLLFGLLWLVVAVGAFGLWVYLMYSAYSGKTTRIPVAAGIADSLI